MRRSVQPSRPKAITCCFFSSLKTLAIAAEAISPHAVVNVPESVSVGRFSGGHHWPVLGDRRGKVRGKRCGGKGVSGTHFPRLARRVRGTRWAWSSVQVPSATASTPRSDFVASSSLTGGLGCGPEFGRSATVSREHRAVGANVIMKLTPAVTYRCSPITPYLDLYFSRIDETSPSWC